MSVIWEQEYYKIAQIAKMLSCEVNDVLHFGINKKLKIAAYINFDNSEALAKLNDDPNSTFYDTGSYYIYYNQLQRFEFNEFEVNIPLSQIINVGADIDEIGEFYKLNDLIEASSKISIDELLDGIDEYSSSYDYADTYDDAYEIVYDEVVPYSDVHDDTMKLNSDKYVTIYSKNLLVLHDDFADFLKNEWPTLKKFQLSIKKSTQAENQKVITSLLKMVIAMATEQYGYDCKANKSEVPRRIVEDAEELGLKIDVGTVRNWLDESAQLLDQG